VERCGFHSTLTVWAQDAKSHVASCIAADCLLQRSRGELVQQLDNCLCSSLGPQRCTRQEWSRPGCRGKLKNAHLYTQLQCGLLCGSLPPQCLSILLLWSGLKGLCVCKFLSCAARVWVVSLSQNIITRGSHPWEATTKAVGRVSMLSPLPQVKHPA